MNAYHLLAWAVAALVPGVALWFAAPSARADLGLAVAPFGWPSLVVVQVLAALPLAAILAARFRKAGIGSEGSLPVWLLGGIGLAFAAFAYLQMDEVGESLANSGFVERAAFRTLGCVLLTLPWCLIVREIRAGGGLLIVSLAAAFVLPAVHADMLAEKGIREGTELVMDNQFVRAKPIWEGVSDLAPERAVPGAKKPMTPTEIRDYLTGEIARLSKQVERGLPPDAPPKERLRLAGMLVNLDRSAEAEDLLRRLPPEPEVLLALGDTLHRQGRFRDSDDAVRPLLDAEAPSLRRAAYEQLARNASARHENAEVGKLLTEAAEKLPRFAAAFQFQLGRHYQQTGQPFAALEAFDRAVSLDPKLAPATEPYRRAIREHTPGCLVGR